MRAPELTASLKPFSMDPKYSGGMSLPDICGSVVDKRTTVGVQLKSFAQDGPLILQ
jgi:hypothetical protein